MQIDKKKNLNIRNNFCGCYYDKLRPLFLSMEPLRRKYLGDAFWTTIISISVPFVLLVLPIWFNFYYREYDAFSSYDFLPIIFLFMFLAGILVTPVMYICLFTGEFYLDIKKKFQKELKEHCLPEVLKIFGNIEKSVMTDDDVSLIRGSGLGVYSTYGKSNERTTKIECDDCMTGIYKDVEFKLMELSNGVRSWGRLVISFTSNKTIKTPAIIASKGQTRLKPSGIVVSWNTLILGVELIALYIIGIWLYVTYQNFLTYEEDMSYLYKFIALLVLLGFPLICFIGITIKNIIFNSVTEKNGIVKLEDNKFDVASKDEVEARYLMTPTFIERFKALQNVYGASEVKCAFIGDKIIFSINSKRDFFELGSLWTPMSDTKQIEEFYKEITAIYDMIDYFKLDEKTGL